VLEAWSHGRDQVAAERGDYALLVVVGDLA